MEMGKENSIMPKHPSLPCRKGRATKPNVGHSAERRELVLLYSLKKKWECKKSRAPQGDRANTWNGNTKNAGGGEETEWQKMWQLELLFAALCAQSAETKGAIKSDTLTTHSRHTGRAQRDLTAEHPLWALVMLPSCRYSELPFVTFTEEGNLWQWARVRFFLFNLKERGRHTCLLSPQMRLPRLLCYLYSRLHSWNICIFFLGPAASAPLFELVRCQTLTQL